MAGFKLLAFKTSKIFFLPLIGQRNFLTKIFHLLGQNFFPQKAIFSTRNSFALVGATIVNKFQTTFLDVSFGGYGIATYPTSSKTQKLKILWSSLFAGLSILNKCRLNLVKKFLCNHWLMRTNMHLATILKMSVVKRIFQNMFNTGEVQRFACLANQAKRKHFALNCCECVFAGSKSP